MTAPTPYPIALYIAGVNRTGDAPYTDLRLDDKRIDVSDLSFKLVGVTGYTPAPNQAVRLLNADEDTIIFDGFITDLRTIRRGVFTDYEITASDKKIQLQKSVTEPGTYTGDIGTILDDLLSNAFPPLDEDFDVDIDPGATTGGDLSIELGDESVLDAIGKIAAELGENVSVKQPELTGENAWLITFDPGGETDYVTNASNISMAVTSGKGQPDPASEGTNAWFGTRTFDKTYNQICDEQITPNGSGFSLEMVMGDFSQSDNMRITDIMFDYRTSITSGADRFDVDIGIGQVDIWHWVDNVFTLADSISGLSTITGDLENRAVPQGTWQTVSLKELQEKYSQNLRISFDFDDIARVDFGIGVNIIGWNPAGCDEDVVEMEIAFDNFRLVLDPASPVEPTNPPDPLEDVNPTIDWGGVDPAPFEFDIGAGEEYLKDLIIDESQDDYNAVVVIGGTVKEAIDWTYESDGAQDHYDLELPVTDYAIYTNSGTDLSPVWDQLTAGIRGKDALKRDGGTADVLYDASYHWLQFNTDPPALARSFRLTGFIEKAIRIAVDESSDGEPTLAMPLHDSSITSEDGAVQRAKTELDNRNGPQRVSLTTLWPGIRPGMELTIFDADSGLDVSPLVQRVVTRWLGGSGHAEFDIEAGPGEELSADLLIAQNDKRSREKTPAGGVKDITTIGILLDDDGNELTDDNLRVLYEVS